MMHDEAKLKPNKPTELSEQDAAKIVGGDAGGDHGGDSGSGGGNSGGNDGNVDPVMQNS